MPRRRSPPAAARRRARPRPPPPRDLIDRLLARHRGAPTRFALLIDRRRTPVAPVRALATGALAAAAVLASLGAMEGAVLPVVAGLALAAGALVLARRPLPAAPADAGPRWNAKALLALDRALADAEPALDAGARALVERIHEALLRLARIPRPRWRLEDAVAVERLIERQLPEALGAAAADGADALEPARARLEAIESRLAATARGAGAAH